MNFGIERIRIAVDVEDVSGGSVDSITGQAPEMWRGNDVRFEFAFFLNGQLVDMSDFSTLTLIVKDDADRRGPKLMEEVVGAADLNLLLTASEWNAGVAYHAAFTFSGSETMLDLRGANNRKFWLVVHGVTTAGRSVTLASARVNIHENGVDDTDNLPPLGSSVIPLGATYDGSGEYDLSVIEGRWYRWEPGTNDTSLVNGTQTLTEQDNFQAQSTTVTLNGTLDTSVTAVVRWPVFITRDEYNAVDRADVLRVNNQPGVTPTYKSKNSKWIRIFGVDDDGKRIDQVIQVIP